MNYYSIKFRVSGLVPLLIFVQDYNINCVGARPNLQAGELLEDSETEAFKTTTAKDPSFTDSDLYHSTYLSGDPGYDFNPTLVNDQLYALIHSNTGVNTDLRILTLIIQFKFNQVYQKLKKIEEHVARIESKFELEQSDTKDRFTEVKSDLDFQVSKLEMKWDSQQNDLNRLDDRLEFYKKQLDQDIEVRRKATEKLSKKVGKNRDNILKSASNFAPMAANPQFPMPNAIQVPIQLIAEKAIDAAEEAVQFALDQTAGLADAIEPKDESVEEGDPDDTFVQSCINDDIVGCDDEQNQSLAHTTNSSTERSENDEETGLNEVDEENNKSVTESAFLMKDEGATTFFVESTVAPPEAFNEEDMAADNLETALNPGTTTETRHLNVTRLHGAVRINKSSPNSILHDLRL